MGKGPVTVMTLHSILEPSVSDEGMQIGYSSMTLRNWIHKNNCSNKYIEDNESLVSQCHTKKLQIRKGRKLE